MFMNDFSTDLYTEVDFSVICSYNPIYVFKYNYNCLPAFSSNSQSLNLIA